MASKDVAPILAKEFVVLKLDWDRQPGSRDLIKPSNGKDAGLPWSAFVDGDGKVLIDSIVPGGTNVGFPAKDTEYAHFKTMLEKVKRHLTDEDITRLMQSLEAANKATT
jgi:hypothetical protein